MSFAWEIIYDEGEKIKTKQPTADDDQTQRFDTRKKTATSGENMKHTHSQRDGGGGRRTRVSVNDETELVCLIWLTHKLHEYKL